MLGVCVCVCVYCCDHVYGVIKNSINCVLCTAKACQDNDLWNILCIVCLLRDAQWASIPDMILTISRWRCGCVHECRDAYMYVTTWLALVWLWHMRRWEPACLQFCVIMCLVFVFCISVHVYTIIEVYMLVCVCVCFQAYISVKRVCVYVCVCDNYSENR